LGTGSEFNPNPFWSDPLPDKHKWRKEFLAFESISTNALGGFGKEILPPEIFCWQSKLISNFLEKITLYLCSLISMGFKLQSLGCLIGIITTEEQLVRLCV